MSPLLNLSPAPPFTLDQSFEEFALSVVQRQPADTQAKIAEAFSRLLVGVDMYAWHQGLRRVCVCDGAHSRGDVADENDTLTYCLRLRTLFCCRRKNNAVSRERFPGNLNVFRSEVRMVIQF